MLQKIQLNDKILTMTKSGAQITENSPIYKKVWVADINFTDTPSPPQPPKTKIYKGKT